MFKMFQGKGKELDSVLAPTFEDMTSKQNHIVQFRSDKGTIQV